MSDFSWVARCPGCGQRFAPDDGLCCVQCDECAHWTDDITEHAGRYYCDDCLVAEIGLVQCSQCGEHVPAREYSRATSRCRECARELLVAGVIGMVAE